MSLINNKVIATLIIVTGLIACSSKKTSTHQIQSVNKDKQELIMQSTPNQRNNMLSIDLMKKLNMHDDNIIISPFSISTAMAMTYGGAREQTMAEMADVLYYPITQEEFHPEFSSFTEYIQSLSSDKTGFELANALYAQENYQFLQEYFDLIIKNYGSVLNYVDFYKGDREAIRQEINEWVESKTNSRIQDLIKPDILNEDTRLVIVNAIYFLAEWEKEFDKKLTYEDVFHLQDGRQSTGKFMKTEDEFKYYKTLGFEAIEIPYNENKFSMLVVLPEENTNIKDFIDSFEYDTYMSVSEGLEKQKVELHLPKFTIKKHIEVQDILIEMGMPLAFSNQADFSGMTGEYDLKIDKVIHQAFIEVDEKGTEAAAATAVVIIRKTAIIEPDEKTIFKANRPFLFFIKDAAGDTIIFMGSVTNPEK